MYLPFKPDLYLLYLSIPKIFKEKTLFYNKLPLLICKGGGLYPPLFILLFNLYRYSPENQLLCKHLIKKLISTDEIKTFVFRFGGS